MRSSFDRSNYTNLHPIKLVAAACGFGVPIALNPVLGFGAAAPFMGVLMAIGVFLLVPPVEKRSAKEARAAKELDPATRKRMQANWDAELSGWPLSEAIMHVGNKMLPRIPNKEVMALSDQILHKIAWVSNSFDKLVDHPQHQATINETVRDYLPRTLRMYINTNSPQHEPVIESTLSTLRLLDDEVSRIKDAIVQGELSKLNSHAEALGRTFGRN